MKKSVKQGEVLETMMKPESVMHISSEDLPEIKKWKVGEEYRLTEVIMKQTSSRLNKDGEVEASFEISSLKANGEYKD